MKSILKLAFLILSVFIIHSCKKDKVTIPVVKTGSTSYISYNLARIEGSVSDEGASSVTSRGICWSTTAKPTTADNKTTESGGPGQFTSNLEPLIPQTKYYARAYAINTTGTGYGEQVSFTTANGEGPVLTTANATSVTMHEAVSGGTITDERGGAVISKGVCWGIATLPTTYNDKTTDGSGSGEFISSISGLTEGTTYYLRAYATNSWGTGYGPQISFTTVPPGLPSVTTSSVTSITKISAVSGGDVTDDGGGSIKEKGICWSSQHTPTIADSHTNGGVGSGSFTGNMSGLTKGTVYNVRAYAKNMGGTSYGDVLSFRTINDTIIFNSALTYDTISDIDGNKYKTIAIGTQVWMAENLKTTRFNDGTGIFYYGNPTSWYGMVVPAMSWYNDAITNKDVYGALYNWYAASKTNLCPVGWHVPSSGEWLNLISYLGGYYYNNDEYTGAGKMKEAGIINWSTPNTGATNESGLSIVPGGAIVIGPTQFSGLYRFAGYWTSTQYFSETDLAWSIHFSYSNSMIPVVWTEKNYGYSVRCVKN